MIKFTIFYLFKFLRYVGFNRKRKQKKHCARRYSQHDAVLGNAISRKLLLLQHLVRTCLTFSQKTGCNCTCLFQIHLKLVSNQIWTSWPCQDKCLVVDLTIVATNAIYPESNWNIVTNRGFLEIGVDIFLLAEFFKIYYHVYFFA